MENKLKKRYHVIPSRAQIKALQSYLKRLAEEQGKTSKREYGFVQFIQKEVLNDPATGKVIRNQSLLSNTLAYLAGEEYIYRIRKGSISKPSLWNVTDFIKNNNVLGREDFSKPKANVEIEVVRIEQKSVDVPAEPVKEAHNDEKNAELLVEISDSMSAMTRHLAELPKQFTSHLKELTDQLYAVDSNAVAKLAKENELLKAEIGALELLSDNEQKRLQGELDATYKLIDTYQDELTNAQLELEKAQAKVIEQAQVVVPAEPAVNVEQVARQCDLVAEKVDEILSAPWKIGKHREKFKDSITGRLTNIKKELGITK